MCYFAWAFILCWRAFFFSTPEYIVGVLVGAMHTRFFLQREEQAYIFCLQNDVREKAGGNGSVIDIVIFRRPVGLTDCRK